MSKDFTEVTFDSLQFKKELDQFGDLLNANRNLGERDLQSFFKSSLHFTCHIGTIGSIGVARQVAYEFEIMVTTAPTSCLAIGRSSSVL